ncbi:S1C family serine protease [Actinomadura viridis]|uniref:S1-C subfamily serine protease n=1 Tax=Actinomadura viridis TaxID=58110 RepID=A0A931GKX8_9ACTN|nr:trypsin-like peptidase domain-containing protein [Actinomadura viridis]MBG6090842.1 S1-C subfamily serine protease [Actinomadura viridis]
MNEIPERRGSGCFGCLAILAVLVAVIAFLAGRPLLEDRSGGGPPAAPPVASPSRTVTEPSGRRPGVVNIDTEQGLRSTRAAGTGILMDSSGVVLTNNHVIQGATAIRGTVTDNGRAFTAEVLGYDKSGDIAVIRLRGAARLRPAVFGDSRTVLPGDPVTAVGNAGGKGGAPTVVTGKVTALDRQITATDQNDGSTERLTAMIETDAPIRPGDSGGPLLNTAGQVIGMNTAASVSFRVQQEGNPRGYAIPSDRALAVARQIQRGEGSATVHIGRTPMLGVQVRSPGAAEPGGPPPPATSGALIADLIPGTPAEAAGLRPGAVIVALNDRPVDSPATLTDLLLLHHPGDIVRVGWVDTDGRRYTTPVRLAEGPPQ